MERLQEIKEASLKYNYSLGNINVIAGWFSEEDELKWNSNPSFIEGANWADSNPSNETIEKVLKLSGKYNKLSVTEQQKINLFDYIKLYWND